MNIGRSPELILLLMTCTMNLSSEKKKQIIQFLSQYQLDWDYLYRLGSRHRVIPFLYRTLQDLPIIPENFLAKLRHECQTIAMDNMLKLQEYHRVAKLLSEHKIDHITFKGVYLAENNYPDSSLRSIGDLDILIDKKNLFDVINLLESDHYQLGQKYKHYMQYSMYAILADLYEVSLFRPFFNKSHFDIDLHWEIDCLNKQYASFYLHDILFPSTLIKEHQIILLVVHHGVINMWQQIVYINDLFFSLNSIDIKWDWLFQELRRYGLETVFLVGVYWCQQIWNLPLSPSVHKLISSEQIRLLAKSYEKNWKIEKPVIPVNPGLKQITFFISAQTQLTKKLKIYISYISNFIFRSSLIRIGTYQFYIPKQFGFLTVIFRAIQGMYKSLVATL